MKKTIALLTDFGTEDGYVGAMKGKILSMAPNTDIIDISHDITPFDTRQAAYCLMNCYSYFPEDTIFVIVIDPGVGSSRKGLVLQTANHYFIGPDNGVFSFIYGKEAVNAFEIDLSAIPWKVSSTFHGRDVFSPLAALLAKEIRIDKYIAPTEKHKTFIKPIMKVEKNVYRIPVVHIDHFGNVILNFQRTDQSELTKKHQFKMIFRNHKFDRICNTFSDVPRGKLLLLWDSSDYLQIAQNTGRAVEQLGITLDDEVELAV